jgi:hypothetical protein
MKNPDFGKRKCRDCLLSPNNEDSYFGIYKFIANALELQKSHHNGSRPYPCEVVNFYACPYDRREESEVETVTRNVLFSLNQIAEIIGRTLSKALNIRGNRIIYKIDFESGEVQEIDTFLCGDKYADNIPGGKPVYHELTEMLEKIVKLSYIPMTNLEDIFMILTDEDKMKTVLDVALEKQYLQQENKIVQFFMSIKGNIKKEDLTIRLPLAHFIDKNKCSICYQPSNINCVNCTGKDIWICVNHLKKHREIHTKSR